MINPIYNLPEIQFVGGESQILLFNLVSNAGRAFDAKGCKISLALIPFINKRGNPVVIKEAELIEGARGMYNIARFELKPNDTVHLVGEYIYQITIINEDNISEIPSQGIMHIVKNIHTNYITG